MNKTQLSIDVLEMQAIIALLVCALAVGGSGRTSLRTFASPDGTFRFQYSDILVNCALPQNPTSSSCSSQGGVCAGPGSDGQALACFAYPNEKFKDKPSFVAAAFYVSEIRAAQVEKVCLEKSPNWYVIGSTTGTTTINHVVFKTFEIGDNWTGGGQHGPVYRSFHDGRCYELGVQNVISRAEYDPETVKEFTKSDWLEVESALKQSLNSFVFLK